jgi:hypothetical protein
MSHVLSILVAVFNCYLGSMIIESDLVKTVCSLLVYSFSLFSIIWKSFNFSDMSDQTRISLSISIAYLALMVPAFVYTQLGIKKEIAEQIRWSYYERDSFRKMFDSLTNGILCIHKN